MIGYVALSPYRKGRRAFSHTCEISYYLFSGYRGRGFGKELVRTALSAAREAGFETAIAIILGCNLRSIRLLEGFGFSVCGTIPNAACLDGTRIDHVYLALDLTRAGALLTAPGTT